MEALRGRDSGEYERLMSEMTRLRESWVAQELDRVRAAARLANVNKVIDEEIGIQSNCMLLIFCRIPSCRGRQLGCERCDEKIPLDI